MSLDYELNLITDLNPDEVLKLLADELGFTWGDETCLNGTGIVIGAIRRDERGQVFIESVYGFRPNLCVWFQLNKFANYDEGYRNMFRSVTVLLSRTAGDAILLWNLEMSIVRRFDHQIVFNSKWSESSPDELALPHKLRFL